MLTNMTCPVCQTSIGVEIKQTTDYKVEFKKDGSASRYEQQIENLGITHAKELKQIFNEIHKKLQPKLKKGIKKQRLKNILRKKHKLDYQTTQAFISRIKKEGVIEKNKKLKYPT